MLVKLFKVAYDFPVSMQISHKYSLIFVITKLGLLFVYDLETASAIYRNRISPDPIFLTAEASSVGGFYAINRRGQVLLATANEATIVPFVSGQLNNLELAVSLAKRGNLPGAENLVAQRFQELFAQMKYKEAAELAAESPQGILHTPDTVAKFQSVPVQPGQTRPLLQYFGTLLTKGKLNAFESLELSRLVVNQNKKNLLENWLAEDKLECSEELGDLVKTVANDLALKIFIKARATPKVVAAFAERREFDKILIYSKQVGYTPDYLFLLQTILRSDPQGSVNFALMMSQMEGGCPVDYNTITDLFLQVLEINLVTFPNVADAILANGMFSHYDRPWIAQLCEKAGLFMCALQHYMELSDVKHVIVNTHAIEPHSLVEFFGTLSREWALECMKDLLLVAKEYSDQLGVESCIKLFERFKSYERLYFFLGSYLSSSKDPDIHFKYTEAASKTGQIKEVERVTRESNFYDPEKTKNFFMEAKLPDARPLINVNPGNAPLVVGKLLDDECPEDFIKGLILSVRSLLPVEPLVEECEKRNRLRLLTQFLEHLVNEGSQDVHAHNALGKIIIDSNNNPEHFLTTNPYYDSRVVVLTTLAVVAYRRGQYVVERMDANLWEKVVMPGNEYRLQLIDEVVSTALPESKSPEQVSATVKAFMTADLPHELIEHLEKIVLQNSAFSGNSNLQNLLILTAIRADKSRVMDYVNRLDNFDGPSVGEIAVEGELYEEAFAIFKKFNLNVQAENVLLDNIQSIERAVEFAFRVEEDAVWSQVAKAQLREGLVSDAIESFIRADDATQFLDVIKAAEDANVYHDLVKYLLMVRQKTKEPKVDSELIYAYAKIDRLAEIEDFILAPNVANLQTVAAKIIFTFISNWAKLACTLVKLRQFEGAVDAAHKAKVQKTWKEVCFACVDAEEFRLAEICGLNIIVQVDDLEEVSDYYQNGGYFDEFISLMESGLGLERAHMGIFTELGILYARYRPEKLMEHKELAYLYIQYDEFDNAATTVMNHSPEAWDHMQFKDISVKVASVELYYKALHFYLQEHPDLINDLLNVLATKVDHTRVVDIMRKVLTVFIFKSMAGNLHLVKPYMVAVQSNILAALMTWQMRKYQNKYVAEGAPNSVHCWKHTIRCSIFLFAVGDHELRRDRCRLEGGLLLGSSGSPISDLRSKGRRGSRSQNPDRQYLAGVDAAGETDFRQRATDAAGARSVQSRPSEPVAADGFSPMGLRLREDAAAGVVDDVLSLLLLSEGMGSSLVLLLAMQMGCRSTLLSFDATAAQKMLMQIAWIVDAAGSSGADADEAVRSGLLGGQIWAPMTRRGTVVETGDEQMDGRMVGPGAGRWKLMASGTVAIATASATAASGPLLQKRDRVADGISDD
ncbi:hypothetical protein ACLOJK_027719 [Asimina triloba]